MKEKTKKEHKKLKLNKKAKTIGGIILGVILVIIAGILVYSLCFSDSAKEKKQIKMLTKEMEDMGKDFYEDYFYPQLEKQENDTEKLKEILKRYESVGIKVSLDTLGRYNSKVNQERIEKFVNHKSKEACDNAETYVSIFPKEEYGKKDYTLDIKITCGYEEK